MCIRASEESLSYAANTTLWPQKKTADILSYPQRQRATQKRNNAYLHFLQEKKRDPLLGSCYWLLSSQLYNENFPGP